MIYIWSLIDLDLDVDHSTRSSRGSHHNRDCRRSTRPKRAIFDELTETRRMCTTNVLIYYINRNLLTQTPLFVDSQHEVKVILIDDSVVVDI
jgi:hypothetical protein